MKKIVFSATGRTVKVADYICEKWSNPDFIDISENNFTPISLSESELCLITAPVYGGCIPQPAADNILKINANGAKAVIAVVYGNRAYDDALAHLKYVCEKAGFTVVAAVAAVAQHSVMPQVAENRPDENDRAELAEWGEKILEMYKNGSLSGNISVPGNIPGKIGTMPVHPKADSSCVKCGLCAEKCPAGAISKENPMLTDNSICITCMRCVEICPNNSRKMLPGILKTVGVIMKKVWGKYNHNEFYIE